MSIRRRSTFGNIMDKEKSPVNVHTTEIFTEPKDEELADVSPGYFQRRRNRIFIGVTAGVILFLVILIPIIHQFYLEPREKAPSILDPSTASPSTYAVVKANFPDPCLIEVDGGFYAFATRPLANISLNIQAASATQDISQWTLHDGYDALPVLPSWVKTQGDSGVWAPQVVQRPDGTFLMYFAALHYKYPRRHCIGVATSPNVLGPYTPDNSSEPLVCHLSLGGIIDPAFLADPISNQSVLIYKNDGNSMGSGGACGNSVWPNTPTTLQYDIMSPDTYSTFLDTGSDTRLNATAMDSTPKLNVTSDLLEDIDPSTIFLQNARSDGPNIESPQAWYQEYTSSSSNTSSTTTRRAYHLLYNSGCFADSSYRINHLVCWLNETIQSFTDCPWAELKAKAQSPLLKTGTYPQPGNSPVAALYAPGGPGVTTDGRYMAFHADINLDWFNHTQSIGNERSPAVSSNATTNGTSSNSSNATASAPTVPYTRQRALFIAELEESNLTDKTGLSIKRLILPSS